MFISSRSFLKLSELSLMSPLRLTYCPMTRSQALSSGSLSIALFSISATLSGGMFTSTPSPSSVPLPARRPSSRPCT